MPPAGATPCPARLSCRKTGKHTYFLSTNGRLHTRITRSGQTFSYVYDALGRVTTVTAPSGTPDSSDTYDNFSNLLTASNGAMTIINTWDARGRLILQAGPNGTVSYSYDAASRRTGLGWPDAFYVAYDYNAASQLTAIRENGATSGVGVLATFTYDDLGRRTQLTRGNGTVTDYSFDGEDGPREAKKGTDERTPGHAGAEPGWNGKRQHRQLHLQPGQPDRQPHALQHRLLLRVPHQYRHAVCA